MSSIFEQLSTELLLQILSHVSDLRSLDSIVHASPSIYRIFQRDAVRIVDRILWSGSIAGHTRNIICILTCIRSHNTSFLDDIRKSPIRDNSEFHYLCAGDAQGSGIENLFIQFVNKDYDNPDSQRLTGGACTLEHIPPGTKATVLLSILATSRQLMSLSEDCLTYYLARYRKLNPISLKDTRRANYRFRSLRTSCPGPCDWAVPHTACGIDRCLKRSDYLKVKDIGAPMWIEWQRVLRAFWRIQFLQDLKRVTRLVFFPRDWLSFYEMEHLGILSFYECGRVHGDFGLEQPDSAWKVLGESRGYQELLSVIEYMYACHGHPWPGCVLDSSRRPDVPWADYVKPEQPKYAKTLLHPAPAEPFLAGINLRDIKERHPFDFYRRLGFAFWSEQRLVAFGLYPWKGLHSNVFLRSLAAHACRSLFVPGNIYPDPLQSKETLSCATFPCNAQSWRWHISRKKYFFSMFRQVVKTWPEAQREWEPALVVEGGLFLHIFNIADCVFRALNKIM